MLLKNLKTATAVLLISVVVLGGSALFMTGTLSGQQSDNKKSEAIAPHPLAAKVGNNCIVQFRRNLLGAASDKPISPAVVGTVGVADYAVSGKLSQVTDHWIVVDGESGEYQYHIPRETVLAVMVHKKGGEGK